MCIAHENRRSYSFRNNVFVNKQYIYIFEKRNTLLVGGVYNKTLL